MGGATRLLLLLLAGVAVSTAVDLYKRIIGGQECGNNERHYHVKLIVNDGRDELCGGSLISERWILTSRHCKANTMTAYLGLHPRTGEKIPPMKITDPPEIFDKKYDIMMLKLPEAAQIQPVALPTTDDCDYRPKIGDKVQIAGYGPTADHGPWSQTLQCAKTKIAECILIEPDKEFCFAQEIPLPMPGDSGGGVVFNNRIYGIIADQISYQDVCEFLEWIKDTMNKP